MSNEMFVKIIDENRHNSNENKIRYVVEINEMDDWKFQRWIEVINSYDTSRKSTNAFNQLVKEIQEDYDKDFKEEKIW